MKYERQARHHIFVEGEFHMSFAFAWPASDHWISGVWRFNHSAEALPKNWVAV